MWSFLSNIKKSIQDKLNNKRALQRKRRYQVVVMGSKIITENDEDEGEGEGEGEDEIEGEGEGEGEGKNVEPSPPPSTPNTPPIHKHRFFQTEITYYELKNYY